MQLRTTLSKRSFFGARSVRRSQWSSSNSLKLQKPVRALPVSRPSRPLRRLCGRLRSCSDSDRGGRNGKMRTFQRESNEESYWELDGEAPKNTSRNVGHGRRFKISCQPLRGVSQEAPIRNVNLWVFLVGHNTVS